MGALVPQFLLLRFWPFLSFLLDCDQDKESYMAGSQCCFNNNQSIIHLLLSYLHPDYSHQRNFQCYSTKKVGKKHNENEANIR